MYTKHIFFLFFCVVITFLSPSNARAQCSTVPTTEAVRNGNFEAGYLTSNGAGKHNFVANGPFDFASDLNFAGNFAANPPTGTCLTGIANRYAVARAEPGMTCTASPRQAYAGTDYINVAAGFTDHTPGQNGNGFALVVDFEAYGGIASYGAPGLAAAWRQNVNIYPNERYYFSAWFANYNFNAGTGGYTNPTLNFVVIPINGGGALVTAERQVVGSATPTGQMNWQQFYGQWTPTGIYNRAALFIEVTQANLTNANDLVIDDISFVNGCNNLTSLPAAYTPNLGPDFSLCLTNGTAVLNSNVATGGTTQFWWYSGTGSPQTQLVGASSTANTYSISTPGTYRVCVQNAGLPAGCSASSTIVVTNTMPPVTLANQTLCTSSTATLTASLTGPGLTYNWHVRPGGVANVNSPTLNTSVTGNYAVQVTSPVAGCGTVTSNTATVTSNLASGAISASNCSVSPRTFTLTAGGGVGNTYTWWDAASGGNTLGSGTPIGLSYTAAQLPRTVYVENYNSSVVGTLRTGANSNSAGDVNRSLVNFTAQQNFTLVSVWVGSDFGTGTVTLTLDQNGSAVGGSTRTATVTQGGWTQVPLNWNITAGSSYRINVSGPGMWLRTSSTTGSTSYGGIVTISGNVFGTGSAMEWTIRTGSPCLRDAVILDCPAPVTYVSFNAEKTGSTVYLNWITATEKNALLFVVERSSDGHNFKPIGEVRALNNPNGGYYSFTDDTPEYRVNYYRLRQVDIDGTAEYSEIKKIEYLVSGNLQIVPNPSGGNITISIPGIEGETTASVSIFNSMGQEVFAKIINTSVLTTGFTADLTPLAQGSYIVKVSTKQGVWIEQLIKH